MTEGGLDDEGREGVTLVAVEYPGELSGGLMEIMNHCPYRNFIVDDPMSDSDVCGSRSKWAVRWAKDESLGRKYSVSCSTSEDLHGSLDVRITYNRRSEAFRGLGRLFSELNATASTDRDLSESLNFMEEALFDSLGVMIDCSRGAVPLVKTLFSILRYCALMGLNQLQLYMEDTYTIPDEPFFGYLRGRYSFEELSRVDNYAFDLGIEVFPSIQTLGHLGQILQWPRFQNMRDTQEVLLASSPATYSFIEKMIAAASAPFRSTRIHIGMDEAYGVGEGRYRHLFGPKDGTQIFLEHLEKVTEICHRRGLRPLIWSDMIFCLANKNHSLQAYYEASTPGPELAEFAERLPSDVQLVYWDYYHTNPEVYLNKIKCHRKLGCQETWVAAGIWTWYRFWSALPFTFEACRACLKACVSQCDTVKNVYVTIWGDDGNECDIYSALPALMFFAQHGYTQAEDFDMNLCKKSFKGICGGDFDDWIRGSKVDDIAPQPVVVDLRTHFPPNTGKWLLWEDPFYSFLSPQHRGLDYEAGYSELYDALREAAVEKVCSYPLNGRLKLPALLSLVLSLKCRLRELLSHAYQTNNRQALASIIIHRLVLLRERVDDLWRYHRKVWLATNKPQGLEVVELRYGGLRTRLESLHDRLAAFLGHDGHSTWTLDSTLTANLTSKSPAIPTSAMPCTKVDTGNEKGDVRESGGRTGGNVTSTSSAALSDAETTGWKLSNDATMPDERTVTDDALVAAAAVSAIPPLPEIPSVAVATVADPPILPTRIHSSSTHFYPSIPSELTWTTAIDGSKSQVTAGGLPGVPFGHEGVRVTPSPLSRQHSRLAPAAFTLPTFPALRAPRMHLPVFEPGEVELSRSSSGSEANIPELAEDLHCIYAGMGTALLLDYARAATPMRGFGTG